MPSKTDLVPLDSEDTSISVAEARHAARRHMLVRALDALFELGMNPETKEAVRSNALQFIVNFASEAQGNGSAQIGKLSPAAARLIAKLGLQSVTKPPAGSVPSDGSESERLSSRATDGDGGGVED